MAITSLFYAGDTDTIDWAVGSSRVGIRYVAHGPGDCKVTKVTTGTRTVAIAPGRISGGGVSDYNDAEVTIELPLVTSGTTWFLIGARRTWQTSNATVFDYIEGSSSPTIPPRPTDAGDEDFQPLALVPVTAGQSIPGDPIDLRAVGTNSGILVAQHNLVRSYMDEVGTVLRIGSLVWHRTVNDSGVASWVNVSPASVERLTGAQVTEGPAFPGWITSSDCRLVFDGTFVWVHVEVEKNGSLIIANSQGVIPGHTDLVTLKGAWSPPGIAVSASGYVESDAGARRDAGGRINANGRVTFTSTQPDAGVRRVVLDAFYSLA